MCPDSNPEEKNTYKKNTRYCLFCCNEGPRIARSVTNKTVRVFKHEDAVTFILTDLKIS